MSRMNWESLLSQYRLGSSSGRELARSAYHKDYDRIVFSTSFRQLNRKTQVHPLTNSEGIHTRLTHSLEVSCVGRSLAMLVYEQIQDALPSSVGAADLGVIVQAACLAHDIGNPPFGHAGEYAIRDWFLSPKGAAFTEQVTPAQAQNLTRFEGNAQGFRLLTSVENHPKQGGMRLTSAVLGAFLKYPWQAAAGTGKFGCFETESSHLEAVATELGLIKNGLKWARHPLAYLMEAADDICYALIDLEDAIALGMLRLSDVEGIFTQIIGEDDLPPELFEPTTDARKLAALRGRAMNRLVHGVSEVFVAHHDQLLSGSFTGSLLDGAAAPIKEAIQTAKQIAKVQIFDHPQKARLELVATDCLHVLLDAFAPLALNPKGKSFSQERLTTLAKHRGVNLGGSVYENLMNVLGMISQMTDHQAYELAQELRGRQLPSA